MNILEIREASHHALQNSEHNSRKLTFFFMIVLLGVTIPCELFVMLLEYEEPSNFWRALFSVPTAFAVVIELFSYFLDTGYRCFALQISRGNRVTIHDFSIAFRNFGRFLVLYCLKTLLILLWSLLLLVPGYLALFRYRLAEELMMDDPELSPWDALRLSAKLTKGHRLKLFELDVCFFLHFVLTFLAEEFLEIMEVIGHPVEGNGKIAVYLFCMFVVLMVELWHKAHLYTARACAYQWIVDREAVPAQ